MYKNIHFDDFQTTHRKIKNLCPRHYKSKCYKYICTFLINTHFNTFSRLTRIIHIGRQRHTIIISREAEVKQYWNVDIRHWFLVKSLLRSDRTWRDFGLSHLFIFSNTCFIETSFLISTGIIYWGFILLVKHSSFRYHSIYGTSSTNSVIWSGYPDSTLYVNKHFSLYYFN